MISNPEQVHLDPEALRIRQERNKDFLEIATTQIKELYQFLGGAGYVVSITDKDGYLLDIIGDQPMLDKMGAGNLLKGYRWTERDTGTSALGLALERKIPVQISEEEHFCKRGQNYACSASPVIDEEGKLVGLIALSGDGKKVHPHTLGMVITAARSIENQLRISRASRELLLRNNYMNAIIDSIDSGVMTIDRKGIITQINDQGRQILQVEENPEGKHVATLLGSQVDLDRLMRAGFGYADRELFIRTPNKSLQLIHTAQPIFDSDGNVQGVVFIFHEIKRIRKLINEMAGSQARFTFENIVGVSPGIQAAKRLAMLSAESKSTVLLLGETGTGKELFAQAIHNQSNRRHNPFVAINCCAIPRELLESELFGYGDGAFTGARKGGRPGKFELASGGTFFLDEIGDMPTDMQAKLLRVLQTESIFRIGEANPISVDIRVIAATHCDLKQEVIKGDFREDLFYRLNVFPIFIPPLRERSDDILLLAKHILDHYMTVLDKPGLKLSPEATKLLLRYSWPGNVRELENVLERAVNLADGNLILPETLSLLVAANRIPIVKERRGALLEEVERQTIEGVLKEMTFNLSKSSKRLGISRATLYKKIKKYSLSINRASV